MVIESLCHQVSIKFNIYRWYKLDIIRMKNLKTIIYILYIKNLFILLNFVQKT